MADPQAVEQTGQDKLLAKMYGSAFGRGMLKILIRPWFSKLGGWVLNRRISCIAIKGFVESNSIDLSEYEDVKFKSFNQFFMRKIKPEARPIEMDPKAFVSPCDSKLMVFDIDSEAKFMIKNTEYTLEGLLRNGELAREYEGGQLLLFRLSVDDYHRYCYLADGHKLEDVRIPGVFHTVNPIANDVYPIYKENTRVYSILQTEEFGDLIVMEVGALLVGKIVNYHGEKDVVRGEEKGRFEFGGSTIIVCVKQGIVDIDEQVLTNTAEGIETRVKFGARIGAKRA